MKKKYKFLPYASKLTFEDEEMLERSKQFLKEVSLRRTVRDFSDKPVNIELIENAIKSAATAPNGANQQPWHFAIVSDPLIKRKIREEAEAEEKAFYEHRAPDEWLEALAPLGTNELKPFLETAPYLIVIFEEKYGVDPNGKQIKHYYTKESVGIACGILITALHLCGLATLTHTPSPMNFLNKLLDRPSNEKPYLILVTGYPSDNCLVPDIKKKDYSKIVSIK